MKKNQFIEGFKDPTPIRPIQDILLCDVKGDGDSKLILYDQSLGSLIVYKGVNRELQRKVELGNVSGLITYYDEIGRTPVPCLAMAAENGFYIFRGLKQSFRLRVPNLEPEPQQQEFWLQHSQEPQRLCQALREISSRVRLTEQAKYLVGATTLQRKQELITKTLTEGIIQKDAICSMCVIRQQPTSVGNVVLMTELRKMHFLDSFGHTILKSQNMTATSFLSFAHGQLTKQYYVVSLSRDNVLSVYQDKTQKHVNLGMKTVAAAFDFPTLYVVAGTKMVSAWDITKMVKGYSLKLADQPFKAQILRTRSFRALILGFQKQIRIYNQKLLVYQFSLKEPLLNLKFGSFGRQEGCLLVFYEDHGFEVKIMHRQFNGNQKFEKEGSNKAKPTDNIPIPKKTNLFVAESVAESQNSASIYNSYLQDMRLLKWRCLKQQASALMAGGTAHNIKINSAVLGLGPSYILRLEIENTGQQNLYQLKLVINCDTSQYQLGVYPVDIGMMVPHFSYPFEVSIKSIGETVNTAGGTLKVCVINKSGGCSAIGVQLPSSE